AGAKVEAVPPAPGGVDLGVALDLLGRHDVLQAMVEGGPTLHGALLLAGLVDRVVAYVAPTVLGPRARPAFPQSDPATLPPRCDPAGTPAGGGWRLRAAATLGDDVRLEYEPEER